MSTETVTSSAVVSTPSAVVANADPNAFTDEEMAVLEGKAAEAKPATEGTQATGQPPAGQQQASGEAEEAIDGEIEIGNDGTPRDLKTGRFVPRSFAMRLKEQNKALSERANSLATEVVRSRERLAIYNELSGNGAAAEQKPTEVAKPINPDEDIFGALKQALDKVSSLEEKLTKTDTESKARIEEVVLHDYVAKEIARGRSSFEDFDDAFRHVYAALDTELQEDHDVADPEARKTRIMEALREDVRKHHGKDGPSFADRLMRRAKRYGYAGKAAPQTKDVDPAAKAQIERINNSQAATATLRHSGSGNVPEPMTVAKLADMPEKEFLKVHGEYVAKNGVQAWNDFMAGKRTW